MVFLKTDEEVELLRKSNDLLGMTYGELAKVIAPGVTTAQLDKIAHDFICDHGGVPACLGYEGYPATLCTSVNEQVVHGIPSKDVVLKEGDIISVDSCINLNGYISDSAYTFPVGEVSADVLKLMKTTKECLYLGIEQAVTGKRLGDLGYAIQSHAEQAGYSVCREYVGHGIGREMHEDEPMILMGRRNVLIEDDGWTARTCDRKPAAHYELSVCVRNGKADILSTFDYIQQVLGDRFI